MKYLGIFLTFLGAFAVTMAVIQDAEARRMGGGKSFGSRPGYSSPYKRSVTPNKPLSRQQQAAQQQNAQRRTQLASRGGLWGMLGGLALGGLLGALLFGGAFENLNLFDIVVFALIAFLLYRLFVAWRRSAARASGGAAAGSAVGTGGAATYDQTPETQAEPGAEARRSWGLDSEEMDRKYSTGSDSPDQPVESQTKTEHADFPPGFDKTSFLAGAERAYRMLQEAWDQGDLDALRKFTTDPAYNELKSQLTGREGENRTEILGLETNLLEVQRAGKNLEAAVLFEAHLRELDAETPSDANVHQVREVWHFIRPVDAKQPTWYLDGIQQVED